VVYFAQQSLQFFFVVAAVQFLQQSAEAFIQSALAIFSLLQQAFCMACSPDFAGAALRLYWQHSSRFL
jgi:hypothetical protein